MSPTSTTGTSQWTDPKVLPTLYDSIYLLSMYVLLTYIQGGKFKLLLTLPVEYPFKPPTINFKTRIWHPNVTFDEQGSMCIGILKGDTWKPSSRIMNVLIATQNLLTEPVPDDALETSS